MQILLIFQSSPEVDKFIVKEGEGFLISIFLEANTVKFRKYAPGLIFSVQRPFLRGLYSVGLTYGGKIAFQNRLRLYLDGNLRLKIVWTCL